jgi:hypothetical protein
MLRVVNLTGKDPQEAGRFGDVWREEIHGRTVAIKAIRTYAKSNAENVVKVIYVEFPVLDC